MSDIWNNRFMSLAKEFSSWSKDPSTQVGSVVVDSSKRILASGYNGFPRGIEDTQDRLTNRELKLSLVVHSEMNCIYTATYHGVSLQDASIYVYGLPVCSDCCKGIIQVGIKKIYVLKEFTTKSEYWLASWNRTKEMCKESGVDCEELG